MMSSARNGFPFTASQWQELEHQALIYKYMVSGIPIPPDLLFTIKRNCLDSSLPSKLFSHQSPHIGWSCFQMGLGRKVDPEPGRCRRTDGKKWRCSKEAYPDSKYCERHMHRGKNRSRKPVEVTPTLSTTKPILSSINKTPSTLTSISSLSSENRHNYPSYNNHLSHAYLCSNTSSSRPPGISLSPQDSSTHLGLDSGSYSLTSTDYSRNRYIYGLKEDVDEHAFFSEPSGTIRSFSGSSSLDDSWQLTPLTMTSSFSSKQRNDYSSLQLQSSLTDHQKQDQHSYLLDSQMALKLEREEQEEPQKTVHHFFDEWPHKNKNSWLDLDDKSSISTTRLSISIPSSSPFSHLHYKNSP
ncbi:growth-regulating factor 1-like isoform X1 [Tripterygium wilfordii]|uniref:growth-regulating factor 1-like isoform X1 n=1 Tax=Tripterygium wilfordii TaxID=458696 RepID=UPI0018F8242D|nr:growth-regulating factor 1-like isoform X1 [Tripterygium wilfordii]